jgi:hypothetical protein
VPVDRQAHTADMASVRVYGKLAAAGLGRRLDRGQHGLHIGDWPAVRAGGASGSRFTRL